MDRGVIVTGGGSGIGRGIAETFAKHGDRVVIIGRNEEKLRATAQELGRNVAWQRADVSERHQVVSAVKNIVSQFKEVHVLANNAGPTISPRITTETPLEEAGKTWDQDIASGLKGAFLTSLAVVPHMVKPGGRIINISSIAAFTGGSRPGSIAYATAKAGLLGLTYSLARELSPKGITVNAIAPGFIANTGTD